MQIGSNIARDFKEQIKHFIVSDSDFSLYFLVPFIV